MTPLKLDFDWCTIILHNEIPMSGGISFTLIEKGDGSGNIIYPAFNRPKFIHELDNHQAYELALSILKSLDVTDTRGSK